MRWRVGLSIVLVSGCSSSSSPAPLGSAPAATSSDSSPQAAQAAQAAPEQVVREGVLGTMRPGRSRRPRPAQDVRLTPDRMSIGLQALKL